MNLSQHPFVVKFCSSVECFLRFVSLVVGVLGTVGME